MPARHPRVQHKDAIHSHTGKPAPKQVKHQRVPRCCSLRSGRIAVVGRFICDRFAAGRHRRHRAGGFYAADVCGFSRAVTRLVNAVKAFGQFARAVLQLFGVGRGFRQRAAEAVKRKAVDLPRRRTQVAGSSHFVAERGQIVPVPFYVCVKIRVHRDSPADHALA